MALILEQLSTRGDTVVRRIAVEAREVTFGRAFDNDVVLEDPHVDAHHARLVVEPDGVLILTDLESVNGLELVGSGRVARIALVPELRFRMGRTSFHVRDANAPIAPAIPLAAETLTGRWIERPMWALVLLAATVTASAAETWTNATSRDAGTETLGAVLLAVFALAVWGGAWAGLGRALTRRAAFLVHVAIASALTLAWSAAETIGAWGSFLMPAHWESWTALQGALILAIVLVGLVAHLAYATHMRRRTRWISVLAVVVGFSGIALAFDALDEESFTDVPEFTATIRHLPPALVPATGVEAFTAAAAEMRALADKAASESRTRTP